MHFPRTPAMAKRVKHWHEIEEQLAENLKMEEYYRRVHRVVPNEVGWLCSSAQISLNPQPSAGLDRCIQYLRRRIQVRLCQRPYGVSEANSTTSPQNRLRVLRRNPRLGGPRLPGARKTRIRSMKPRSGTLASGRSTGPYSQRQYSQSRASRTVQRSRHTRQRRQEQEQASPHRRRRQC